MCRFRQKTFEVRQSQSNRGALCGCLPAESVHKTNLSITAGATLSRAFAAGEKAHALTAVWRAGAARTVGVCYSAWQPMLSRSGASSYTAVMCGVHSGLPDTRLSTTLSTTAESPRPATAPSTV